MFNIISFALVIGFIVAAAYLFRTKQNLPPSPLLSFPVIGHLHLLKDPAHRCLRDLSRSLGPVFSLKLGSCRAVVVTSASAAEEFLSHENDTVFANRPPSSFGKHVAYNNTAVGLSPYGENWRNLRRICTVEIFSAARIRESLEDRRDEVRALLRAIHEATLRGDDSARVELRPLLSGFTLNVIMRMVAGKRYYGEDNAEAKDAHELVTKTLELCGFTYVGDFLPILKLLDLDGYVKNVKKFGVKTDKFLQGLVDQHRINKGKADEFKNTMISNLLTLQESQPEYYTNEIIKGLALVMIVAGTGPTSVTLEWGMANLLNHPDVLAKAKTELNNVVSSKGRLMEESDMSTCTYLNNVILEILRMYPPGPLLVPHASSVDCKVAGYDIPGGTWLFVNASAIHRDPKVWDEPEVFKPERFDSEEVKAQHGKFIPFGMGKRACPGMGLAQIVLGLAFGSLIQCFDWKREEEKTIDMSEATGITVPKAIPLVAKCKPSPILKNIGF